MLDRFCQIIAIDPACLLIFRFLPHPNCLFDPTRLFTFHNLPLPGCLFHPAHLFDTWEYTLNGVSFFFTINFLLMICFQNQQKFVNIWLWPSEFWLVSLHPLNIILAYIQHVYMTSNQFLSATHPSLTNYFSITHLLLAEHIVWIDTTTQCFFQIDES